MSNNTYEGRLLFLLLFVTRRFEFNVFCFVKSIVYIWLLKKLHEMSHYDVEFDRRTPFYVMKCFMIIIVVIINY